MRSAYLALFFAAACGPGDDPDAGDARSDAPRDTAVDTRDVGPDVPVVCAEACPDCRICVAGECVPSPDGRACGGGVCRGGECCTGCWDGSRCHVGLRLDACGAGGSLCHDCACDSDVCDAGECVPARAADAVAAGAVSSCAHSTDDRIFCWGSAERGSVGHGAFEDIVTSPVDVMGGVSVDVGGAHACAVDASGELWCWGANEHGQLGLGDIGVDRSAPERVSALSAVTAVGLGEDHGCALDAIGKLRCWGAGGSGQLGTGEASDTPTPTTVDAEGIFVAFGAGDRHTCAVTDGQQLYCWGANETAQLGIGERGITRGRTSPTLVSDSILFRTATAGSFHTCAPSVLNVLYCWGDNSRAQLGTGDRADRRLPSMIESGLESPSAGSIHGCAVRNIGTLACWGAGDDGRLGLGDETDRLRPTLVDTRRTWLEVSAGDAHTCAVDMVGALYCWGGGGSGQLGVPDLARALRPVRTCLPGPP